MVQKKSNNHDGIVGMIYVYAIAAGYSVTAHRTELAF
jgi:hypothetical protein